MDRLSNLSRRLCLATPRWLERSDMEKMPEKTRLFLNQQIRKAALIQMEAMHASKLLPWLTYHRSVSLYEADGSELQSIHLAYDGAPRTEFLGSYIDPALKDLEIAIYAQAISMADEYGVSRRRVIQDTSSVVLSVARKTFRRMAEIDRRLLIADGSKSAPAHDWSLRYQAFRHQLALTEASFLAKSRSRPAVVPTTGARPLNARYLFAVVAGLVGAATFLWAL